VKLTLLKDVTSAAKLTSIDISKADCFVDYSKVDIGFTTENAVKAVRKKMSDKQLLDFRLSCRNFLPRLISDTDKNKTRLKSVLRLLVQCNRVAESDVDEILRRHSEYAASIINKEQFVEQSTHCLGGSMCSTHGRPQDFFRGGQMMSRDPKGRSWVGFLGRGLRATPHQLRVCGSAVISSAGSRVEPRRK